MQASASKNWNSYEQTKKYEKTAQGQNVSYYVLKDIVSDQLVRYF
jgi:hypothetical protein